MSYYDNRSYRRPGGRGDAKGYGRGGSDWYSARGERSEYRPRPKEPPPSTKPDLNPDDLMEDENGIWCCVCEKYLELANFSRTQLSDKPKGKRRCKDCVAVATREEASNSTRDPNDPKPKKKDHVDGKRATFHLPPTGSGKSPFNTLLTEDMFAKILAEKAAGRDDFTDMLQEMAVKARG